MNGFTFQTFVSFIQIFITDYMDFWSLQSIKHTLKRVVQDIAAKRKMSKLNKCMNASYLLCWRKKYSTNCSFTCCLISNIDDDIFCGASLPPFVFLKKSRCSQVTSFTSINGILLQEIKVCVCTYVESLIILLNTMAHLK